MVTYFKEKKRKVCRGLKFSAHSMEIFLFYDRNFLSPRPLLVLYCPNNMECLKTPPFVIILISAGDNSAQKVSSCVLSVLSSFAFLKSKNHIYHFHLRFYLPLNLLRRVFWNVHPCPCGHPTLPLLLPPALSSPQTPTEPWCLYHYHPVQVILVAIQLPGHTCAAIP